MASAYVQLDLFAGTAKTELSTHESIQIQLADRDGVDRKCKHLSLWNKRICNNCGDCVDFSSEESIARRRHPDTGTDGVTSDRLECFKIAMPGKVKAKIEISLSCGDSGSWYFGRSVSYREGGSGYSAWPKFSDKYASRYSAFWFAATDILQWFKKQKVKQSELEIIRKMIIDTANYEGFNFKNEDLKALEG